jgi:hypothetical protein
MAGDFPFGHIALDLGLDHHHLAHSVTFSDRRVRQVGGRDLFDLKIDCLDARTRLVRRRDRIPFDKK